MKKIIKRVLLCAVMAALLLICFAVAACGKDKVSLSAPKDLHISDEILCWNAVGGASGYVVEINGKEYDTDANSLDIFFLTNEIKTYNIRVMAVNNKAATVSSWSNTITHTVEEPQNLAYIEIDDGAAFAVGVAVADKNKISGKVIVPLFHDGKPVTAVAKSGFSNCKNITSVILPKTVWEINHLAFEDCTALARINIPSGVETIELKTFSNCGSLNRIVFPYTLENIEDRAFENCKTLTDVVLPPQLNRIVGSAFDGCDSIGSIFIPASVAEMGGSFSTCKGLTVDENNQAYKSDGNCIIRKSDNVLIGGCSNSVIPDYVEVIVGRAFYKCDITDMAIPDNIKTIEDSAFMNTVAERVVLPNSITTIASRLFSNSALTSVVIPSSVETIEERAFEGCKSLGSVVFSEGLKKLGVIDSNKWGRDLVFNGCTALNNVVLPASLQEIDATAFSGCEGLTNLSVADENPYFYCDSNCILSRSDNSVVLGCMGSVIPDYVTCIGEYAFYGCPIESIDFPTGWKEYRKRRFTSASICVT